jgi:hypothetical protein
MSVGTSFVVFLCHFRQMLIFILKEPLSDLWNEKFQAVFCTGPRKAYCSFTGVWVSEQLLSKQFRLLWYPSVGRTPACIKTCNSQDTMSATWRKERSTVETNEIMKTAAHQSESWCWRQLLSLLFHVLMLVLTQLVCGRPYTHSSLRLSVSKEKWVIITYHLL